VWVGWRLAMMVDHLLTAPTAATTPAATGEAHHV
jgi:hypothetical protein